MATVIAVLAGVAIALIALATVVPALARPGDLQKDRDKARVLAAEIATLDTQIDAAVARYSQATTSLEAVRAQIKRNRRLQRLAYQELNVARETLAVRAVALYKNDDITALDAMIAADDFGDLVRQLKMVRSVARSDRDVLRSIEETEQTLSDRALKLTADERTSTKLVGECETELAAIRSRLGERRGMLSGVRADIARLAARQASAAASSRPAVDPPDGSGDTEDDPPDPGASGGSGPWWPLIQSAASSNGISARGMYRLMMVESGGSATIVGPGGYYGLFQYAPSTWRGSWNPWRSAAITDGGAQIKATARAIGDGHGHAWWDPSYSYAFEGR